MRTVARIIVRIALFLILMAIGFAVGFPLGRQTGFMTGSEWAMVQATIVAREAGRSMPVIYEDGLLRIVVKQPEDLYRRARHRAALDTEELQITRSGNAAVVIEPLDRTGVQNERPDNAAQPSDSAGVSMSPSDTAPAGVQIVAPDTGGAQMVTADAAVQAMPPAREEQGGSQTTVN